MLLRILSDFPGLDPEDLTEEMINEYMAREACAVSETTAESDEGAGLGLETAADKKARGEAECSSAAVEMFLARDLMEELQL